MDQLPLRDRTILITGAARRIGEALARACASAGANIVVHFHHSSHEAEELEHEIAAMGRSTWLVEGNMGSDLGVDRILRAAFQAGPLHGLVNSAAIFEPLSLQKTAAALAPNISVNALALGAILPQNDQAANPDLLKSVPAGLWGELAEVEQAAIFLLSGPAYITGEIIHVDGGRHLI